MDRNKVQLQKGISLIQFLKNKEAKSHALMHSTNDVIQTDFLAFTAGTTSIATLLIASSNSVTGVDSFVGHSSYDL